MFCNKCGKPIDKSDTFCRNCGTKLPSFVDVNTATKVQKNPMVCSSCGGVLQSLNGLGAYICQTCGNKVLISGMSQASHEAKDVNTATKFQKNSMICSGCGAVLESLNGLDTYVCHICGTKVIVSGMSEAAYEARVDLEKFEHEERMQNTALSHEKEILQIENKSRRNRIIIGISIAFLAILIPTIVFGIYPSIKQKEFKNQLKELNEDVDSYIDDEDYDKAAKANKELKKKIELLDGDNWIFWMDEYLENLYKITRGEREETGEEAKEVVLKTDLEVIDDMDKNDVVDYLIKQGFVNISCVGRNAKIYQDHYYQVDDITIDGDDDWYSGDVFYDDAEVVILVLIDS